MYRRAMASFADISRGWTIQRRVIGALLMREVLTRFGRHNIGFLWLFVEPMLFTIGITALWYLAGANHGSSLPIIAFALTGYSSVLLWRNMPARCIQAIEPNRGLLAHRRVKVIDLFITRIVLEAAGATISLLVLSLFYISAGLLDPPEDVLMVIVAWFLLAWFGAALAIFVGAIAFFSEVVDKIWHPFSYILFPLSGSGFLVSVLPPAAREVIMFVPMVHGIEMLREGYFGSQVVSYYNPWYIISFSSILTLLGLFILRRVAREVTTG
jgi:ABC-type polysaccharide/polyol phosphate export permease